MDVQRLLRNAPWPQLVGAVMLLWALNPDNPYGYYVLLRFAVCGISIYLAIQAKESHMTVWFWVFVAISILYNPLIRVHLGRGAWEIINALTIVILSANTIMGQAQRASTRVKNT